LTEERGKTYLVKEAFTVRAPCGEEVTVPKGYEFDGYSVAPDLPDLAPAAAHDYLYEHRRWDSGKKVERIHADDLLWKMMKCSQDNVTRYMADSYYSGVRKAGWLPWLRGSVKTMLKRILDFFTAE
jgi:hypothetical protein